MPLDKGKSDELKETIALLRKRDMAYGVCLGKKAEGTVLLTHKTKASKVLGQQAKAAGETGYFTFGTMSVKGKDVTMIVEGKMPSGMARKMKEFFKAAGLTMRINIVDPTGLELESDGDEEEAETKPGSRAAPSEVEERQAAKPAAPHETQATEAPAPEDAPIAEDAPVSEPPQAPPPIEDPAPADGPYGPDGELEALLATFRKHAETIANAARSSNAGAAAKIDMVGQKFSDAIEGMDLSRAASTLSVLVKSAQDVSKRFPPAENASGPITMPDSLKKFFAEVADGIEKVGDAIKETYEGISESVSETAEEIAEAYSLSSRGLSLTTVAGLVAGNQEKPGALDAALAALDKLEGAKVPPRDIEHMFKLQAADPKTYDAAMKALGTMDPGGAIDISPEGITNSLKDVQAAVNAQEQKADVWREKNAALQEAKKKEQEARKEHLAKQAADTRAKQAVAAFKAAHPEPHSPADAAKLAELVSKASAAATDLTTAHAAFTTASTAHSNAQTALSNAYNDWAAADAVVQTERAEHQKLEDKRDLLNALSYGPLSESATPPLDSDSKTKLIEAYEKSPDLGRAALDLVSDAEDPALIVKNVGFIGDKMADGFADKDGNAISASAEDREIMAINALKMGAREGQGYFDGFEQYLKSGEQRHADPNGGDQPMERGAKKERARVAAVNTARASSTADALIGADGKVDFASKDAQEAMDHLMFHPGSLRLPAPAIIDQVRGLKENFADEETGPKMQATLDATKLPAAGSKERDTAAKIVGGSVNESDPTKVTDDHAKQAVLSAMISPLSQGPVGSCFTTAAVRKVREQDPARAMEEFSKIASTGKFTTANGKSYPANTTPPKGENPLMRSWEYSVASAASSAHNSHNRTMMNDALFKPGVPGNMNALGAPDIMGDAWSDKFEDGALVKGIRSKLRDAIDAEITFNYNAGPDLEHATGGGDGRSESGVFEVVYDGKVLTEKAEFIKAIGEIALKTCGEEATSDKGIKILEIVRDPAFADAIIKSRAGGYEPWDDAGGAFGRETTKVLEGGTPSEDVFLGLETAGQDPAVRTRALLEGLAAIPGTDSTGKADDRPLMWTMGSSRGANHVFALLPDDPSFKALKDGDMAANINEQLLEPGAEIAKSEITASEAATMFDNEVERLGARWGLSPEQIETILEKRPDEAMKPGDLKALISDAVEDARKAEETSQLEAWKSKQKTAPSEAKVAAEQKLIEEKTRIAMTSGIDTALVDKFDPPEVVIADTNWGGADGQTYFVIAPDPSTGALRMWQKDTQNNKLTPADDIWVDAQWAVVKE